MGKLIAAINMTLDGFCDHTSTNAADDELHQHYTELIRGAGGIIYGRKTYQLMEDYWPALVKNPSGNKASDEFALVMDRIPKMVFSHTLKSVEWQTAQLATQDIKTEVAALKKGTDKDILVGSPGLIVATINLHLIDELQVCIHPIVFGHGLALFKDISAKAELTLLRTKTFGSGAIVLYYKLVKN